MNKVRSLLIGGLVIGLMGSAVHSMPGQGGPGRGQGEGSDQPGRRGVRSSFSIGMPLLASFLQGPSSEDDARNYARLLTALRGIIPTEQREQFDTDIRRVIAVFMIYTTLRYMLRDEISRIVPFIGTIAQGFVQGAQEGLQELFQQLMGRQDIRNLLLTVVRQSAQPTQPQEQQETAQEEETEKASEEEQDEEQSQEQPETVQEEEETEKASEEDQPEQPTQAGAQNPFQAFQGLFEGLGQMRQMRQMPSGLMSLFAGPSTTTTPGSSDVLSSIFNILGSQVQGGRTGNRLHISQTQEEPQESKQEKECSKKEELEKEQKEEAAKEDKKEDKDKKDDKEEVKDEKDKKDKDKKDDKNK